MVSHFPTNWLCHGGTYCALCCQDVHGDYRPGLLILEKIRFLDPLGSCENLCSKFLLAILPCATGRVEGSTNRPKPELCSQLGGWRLLVTSAPNLSAGEVCKGALGGSQAVLFSQPIIHWHHCMTLPNPLPPWRTFWNRLLLIFLQRCKKRNKTKAD